MTDGEALKRDAHRKLVAAANPAARWLVVAAQQALLRRLLAHDSATADDIRSVVTIPPGVDPTAIGAAVAELARIGLIARIGFAESRRHEAHARPVSLWRLVDRARACEWLAAHPLPPQPAESPAAAVDGGSLFDALDAGNRE